MWLGTSARGPGLRCPRSVLAQPEKRLWLWLGGKARSLRPGGGKARSSCYRNAQHPNKCVRLFTQKLPAYSKVFFYIVLPKCWREQGAPAPAIKNQQKNGPAIGSPAALDNLLIRGGGGLRFFALHTKPKYANGLKHANQNKHANYETC